MVTMVPGRVRTAIAATPGELAPDLPKTIEVKGSLPCTMSLVKAESLSSDLRDTLYNLFDRNMSEISQNTSMSYTESTKRTEMFDPSTRFLLLTAKVAIMLPTPEQVDVKGKGKGKGRAKAKVSLSPGEILLGFCSFRFDTEETMGSREAEVIYCYELQLTGVARGKGLGRVLMDEFERIGKARKLDKGILTCLSGNTDAMAFYTKLGYKPDEIDPTRLDEEEEGDEEQEQGDTVDYRILSKSFHTVVT